MLFDEEENFISFTLYNSLRKYLGNHAKLYDKELKEIYNDEMSPVTFFNAYCNHGSYSDFLKFEG